MNQIKIFSPATVANVSCGFDCLGFAVNDLGDTMTFTKTSDKSIKITDIQGADLPYNIQKNAAGAVVLAMLEKHPVDFGLEIIIHKGFAPGSGLGSSAASSAGAAFAINELLGKPFTELELTKFAMIGEEVACGSPIADNVAAAIHGGFILVQRYDPLAIIKIPVPKELMLVAIHPQVEVKTKDAREVLPSKIPLEDAVTQWANVGGLISGLYSNDYKVIADSLCDVIVEPARKHLIPHFDTVKNAAQEAGALSAGISGSGPTIFALCKGESIAKKVFKAIEGVYSNTNIDFTMVYSKINTQGVTILEKN
ncbi:homoserine kinase [Tenacibaculum agarivorans]|uniref:homoserine kinase n=1 Tax=Tenacibaculum agarivorans TaxID=1908389 RepID=UPI00094B899E|nr:homoserine kinase [Tenacibaculum agarivorans]